MTEAADAGGPLAGLRVVELASIGPGPHCAMLLADLGAEVLRVDRPGGNGWPNPVVDRGRSTVEADIRGEEGRDFVRAAADHADVLIEGLRPGVMERLGLGPEVLCRRNPALIYGRMTGWGQSGPLAQAAGHDINYIAITGALAALGRPDEVSPPPLNLLGDFGGGSLFLAFGLLAALHERRRSGRGQVVDAAIVDGVSSLLTMASGLAPGPAGDLRRERSLLGGAAPFYRCYRCADGGQISVGPLERRFYEQLLARTGAPASMADERDDPDAWADGADRLAALFLTRTAGEWSALLEGTDACFAPVVALPDAPGHPHLAARGTYVEHDARVQAAPAPRFSRTPGRLRTAKPDGAELAARWRASGRPGAEPSEAEPP